SLTLLNEKNRDYLRVKERAALLTKIADAEEIIHLQDSLLMISDYSDEQRRELALNIKRETQKGMNEETQNSSSPSNALTGLQSSQQRTSAGAAQSSFFAYNEKSVKDGERAFERKWGDRSLEDNWRYGGSGSISSAIDDEEGAPGQSISFGITQTEIDEILQDVPNTPEEKEIVNHKINQAMLDKGFSLRSDLDRIEESNEELIRLLDRSPDFEIAAEATYLLYLNAMETGNRTLANQYKTQFDQQFGKTDFSEKIRTSTTFLGQDDVAQSALEQIEKA